MAQEREIVVTFDNGRASFVYDDRLAFLLDHGSASIERASHVEPFNGGKGWIADMSPSNGPTLGPFALRAQALDAERDWLAEHRGIE